MIYFAYNKLLILDEVAMKTLDDYIKELKTENLIYRTVSNLFDKFHGSQLDCCISLVISKKRQILLRL